MAHPVVYNAVGKAVEAADDDGERLRLHRVAPREASPAFADDVREGLLSEPKHLHPKYFYDELGSQLFEAICLLPEYYPTRAENEILTQSAAEIVRTAGKPPLSVLELGSGSAVKTRRIIEAVLARQASLRYMPVDISATALETSARVLLQSYPSLSIDAYASDYNTALAHLRFDDDQTTLLSLFLGSNIGNFDPAAARAFLRALRKVLRAGDALLLGADLKKAARVLEAAYDDSLGVTAAFNLNLLARINREFEADFDLRAFTHLALYNEELGRVEMYLASGRAQVVRLRKLGLEVRFAAGERIHTENSYKYDLEGISRLAGETGFALERTWFDRAEQFSSNLLRAAVAGAP